MKLTGSAALVTGGASGLGRATAAALLHAGAHVVVADLPSSPGSVTEELAGAGPRVRFVPCDVTDPDTVQASVDAASELGPLRVAVSCAGVATPGRMLSRSGPLNLDAFARVVQVNLVGTFNVFRLAAQRIAESEPVDGERGVLVATSSVAAYDGQIGQAAYAASKGGVAALTLPAARELAQHLIRVVSIAPGLFDTPFMAGLPQEARDSLAQQVPHPARLGDPAEFAALVRHIAENPMLTRSHPPRRCHPDGTPLRNETGGRRCRDGFAVASRTDRAGNGLGKFSGRSGVVAVVSRAGRQPLRIGALGPRPGGIRDRPTPSRS
ncbi:SDR family NAD(P)-dependent oxidoreductase [Streptomyces sp. NPDC048420]|uniref:SDR family NAD(P)-dependent oxidoreductase n=1 Tax=Streptomyces sp. NPDC048420 TaxID=3155755 RepID=UPI00343456E4